MNPNEAVCLFLSGIKVIFLASFYNFCSVSTKMKYSIGIKSVLRINKMCSCLQSQTEIKLQVKVISSKLHKVTGSPFLLIRCCMEGHDHFSELSPSPACVQQDRLLGEQLEAFSDCFFLLFQGSYSRYFRLFLIPEWTVCVMALSKTPGDTWPLRAVEFI